MTVIIFHLGIQPSSNMASVDNLYSIVKVAYGGHWMKIVSSSPRIKDHDDLGPGHYQCRARSSPHSCPLWSGPASSNNNHQCPLNLNHEYLTRDMIRCRVTVDISSLCIINVHFCLDFFLPDKSQCLGLHQDSVSSLHPAPGSRHSPRSQGATHSVASEQPTS